MCEKASFWDDLKTGRFALMVQESAKGEKIASPKEVFNITKPMFAKNRDIETVIGIFLDTKNRIISIEPLFSGSISGSGVYPREIVKRMLALEGNALIMVHNHPSGCPEPSDSDYSITLKIATALESIGVALHDHIIVGDSYFSLAEEGYIERINRRLAEPGRV